MKKVPNTHPVIKTKYSDLVGEIEIDWEGRISSLEMLCQEYGIDMKKYCVIGFGFTSFETDYIACKVILLEYEKYGKTFVDISNNVPDISTVDAVQKTLRISYGELSKYIKHINAMVYTSIGQSIQKLNIHEEFDDQFAENKDLPQYS